MTTIAPPRPATEPNPRAVIGGNMPPLEETILLDFDNALRERDGLIERIDALAKKADEAGDCDSDEKAGRMGDFVKQCGVVVKVIEAEREALNRPLLTAQRALKARGDFYANKAAQAGDKVRAKLNVYLQKKESDRRAELARLAEIERQAEVERQRIAEESRLKAEAEAEAERVRLQAIADAEAAKERARLQAIEDERAAAEQREAAAVEVVAEVIEVAPQPVFVPEPEPVFIAAAPEKAPIRGDYGTTVSTVETWHVEVENIRQVPDAYLKHPTVIEALEKVLRPHVKGKNGIREIKGCRIYSTLGSAVR